MFEEILLAVDGSEHGLHAARTVGNLARAMRSERLRIVVAYDPIPPYIGEPYLQKTIDARLSQAEPILDEAIKAVGEIPGEVHTELIEGSAAEAIIRVATTRQSDVIILGSRGLGGLAGALLGSVSQKVVAHAPCPVLVVR